jgi:hypothetical protein
MNTVFDSINVNYSEYSYFNQLSKSEQLHYFFDLYEAGVARLNGIDLQTFFSAIKDSLNVDESISNSDNDEYPLDVDRVDVMIDDHHIMIESNSLKAVRYMINKFIESGYILRRDNDTEKYFRKDKLTKYMRIFHIVDQTSSICLN